MHQTKPDSTNNAPSLLKWSYRFTHRGRKYTLFKRVDSKESPYYLHVTRKGKRHKQSFETNVREVALDRARVVIDSIMDAKWDIVTSVKAHSTVSTLADVLLIYERIAGIEPRTIKNNILEINKILKCVTGVEIDPAQTSLSLIDLNLALKFQDMRAKEYCEAADKDDVSQREARERAYRSSRSSINQARSIFSTRPEHDLMARYREGGLNIPPCVQEFMTCRLRGRSVKADYHQPSDEVIKKAFTRIEELKDNDENAYIGFWLSVGAGLRRKEVQNCKWEYFIQRNGVPWLSGGMGKDGRKIDVPVQAKAMWKLRPFLNKYKVGRVTKGEEGLTWVRRLNTWLMHNGWKDTEKKMHELRAYVGSLIYEKNPHAAMKFMRHKTFKMTEQYYCRYGSGSKPVDVL